MSGLAKLFVVGLLVALGYLSLQWLFLVTEWRPVPVCQEDSVLVGVPESGFSYGRWQFYECGPAVDDYIEIPAVPFQEVEPAPAEFGGFNA